MSDKLLIQKTERVLFLQGILTSETLQLVWQELQQLASDIHTVDVSELERVDSAGLAVLVHLFAICQQQNADVHLSGCNQQLLSLINVYNLTNVFI